MTLTTQKTSAEAHERNEHNLAHLMTHNVILALGLVVCGPECLYIVTDIARMILAGGNSPQVPDSTYLMVMRPVPARRHIIEKRM
jgi:hypothetical protein